METVFLQVLNMSITGSYVILAVMILRLFLKKSPKKYSYLMWAVCAFRLCCPVSFKNIFSIFNLSFFNMSETGGASIEYIPQNIGMMRSPQISTGLDYTDGIVNGSLPAPSDVAASVNPMQIIIFISAVIWLAGIAALLLYGIVSYIMLRIKLGNAVIYKENVYQSDKIDSPFVFGLINPKIYIPFGINENETEYVLAHERYHIKRRDYIIKPTAFLISVIHWFNPLCRIAFMLMSRDMEMSCDEKVLSGGKVMSKEYSASLLSFASNKRSFTFCPLAFGETGIKGRIKNILKYKKPKVYVSVISAVLCAAAAVACVSDPNDAGYDISYDDLKMSDEALGSFRESIVGSMMAEIDYADGERIVFDYGDAIFVYNHRTSSIEKCFDLNKLNCAHFRQGDFGLIMYVSADGGEALLVNVGAYDDIKDFKNYIIDLENGNAKETNKTELKHPFSDFGTYSDFPDAKGWTSTRCTVENDNFWYLTCESFYIGDIKLCRFASGETLGEEYIFGTGTVAFGPRDIYDLVDARLIVGGNAYTISDKSNLTELEKAFSNANEIKGGTACPFDAFLKMTRGDGTEGTVMIASDSCAVYKSGDIYYDYSDGDNGKFLSMFGIDVKTLRDLLY
ncbi:MAG: hypothetical protein J1F64_05525 [Oscillospiraceae bacterium]|nr:hypothetical protein [Oscillospiraceae bacterium]